MRESEAKLLVAKLAAGFTNAEMGRATRDLYVEKLLPYSVIEMSETIDALLDRPGDFLPTIGRIKEMLGMRRLATPPPMQAFEQAYGPKEDRHPLVQQAKRTVGDEMDWREQPAAFMRKPFLAAYQEVVTAAMAEIATPGERFHIESEQQALAPDVPTPDLPQIDA